MSTAILTPWLNTEASIKRKGIPCYVCYTGPQDLQPVSDEVFKQRQRWCKQQIEILKNNPSNAVLMEAK